MEFFGKFRHRVAAFTLVELMVTVAIVAVLATIAIGQFDNFKAMAYRAEANNSLGHLTKLQEVYRISKDKYYQPATGAVLVDKSNAYGANFNGSECSGNPLGFKIKGCISGENRYQYWLENSTAFGYVGVANATEHADSFNLSCGTYTGANTAITAGTTTYTHSYYTNSATGGSAQSSISEDGDTHYITDRRSAIVQPNDILQGCD